MWLNDLHLEIIIGVGIPAIGAAAVIARHFWIKTQCFYLMKADQIKMKEEIKEANLKNDAVAQEIKRKIDKEIELSRETHIEIFKKLNSIETSYSKLDGKIDVLIAKKNNH